MLRPTGVHHVAIIASDYARSRHFYTEVLGLQVVHEHYRAERQSYKLDLQLPDGTQVELFSFPNPPARPSYPEACGLRHLALRRYAGHLQGGRQGHARQVVRVFVLRLHGAGLRRIACPQRDLAKLAVLRRSADGQRGAPGARSKHNDVHRSSAGRLTA